MQHPNTPLLRLPLELRHQIYAYILPAQIHVRLEDDKLRSSPCHQPDLDKRSSNSPCEELTLVAHNGYERGVCPSGYAKRVSGEVWARRLESGWGPHWGCGDRKGEGMGKEMGVVGVCKQLYDEVSKFWGRRVRVNLTDLETLNALGEREKGALLGVVTQLSLTLRMPLDFFQALERPGQDLGNMQVRSWRDIPATLSGITTLKSLSIWLDHTDKSTWSAVDERALLAPLLAFFTNTPVEILVFLPMLHPIHSSPSRHFLPTSNQSNVNANVRIIRKLRQRWRGEVNCRGETDGVHRPDYPFSVDAFDGYMTPCEAEVWEREAWGQGVDVEEMAKEMMEPGNVQCMI